MVIYERDDCVSHVDFKALIASCVSYFFFFFNDTATTEIYTLSLHDALPILPQREMGSIRSGGAAAARIGEYKKCGRCRNKKWAV